MSKLILTRYLYIFDDVCLSLLTALLQGKNLDECNFWASEIYYSKLEDQLWEFIWFIYYDFYFIKNPDFNDFIKKKNKVNNFISVLSVIKNLFKMKGDPSIFILRQFNSNFKNINCVFRGKKPLWLEKYDIKYHKLLRNIKNNNILNVASMLPEVLTDEIVNVLKDYFQNDKYFEIILDESYTNHHHKLLCIVYLYLINREIIEKNVKKIYMGCKDDEVEFYEELDKINPPLSKEFKIPLLYKLLPMKRKYEIPEIISSFRLCRFNCESIQKEINLNWEYNAYMCPLWKERMDKYECYVEDEKIKFKNDDMLEEFYEEYNLEPDEQSYECQNKININMVSSNWKKWYFEIFKENNIYEFSDEFKFNY